MSFPCPSCACQSTNVKDSRTHHNIGWKVKGVTNIRRRRECGSCGYRFTTREVVEKERDEVSAPAFSFSAANH